MLFQDRKDAGQRLAQVLKKYREADVIVFALPRGGVVLGAEIARELGAPLDLIITKKIGRPMNPEYAIGAIAEDGEPVCNTREVERINEAWFQGEVERIRKEIRRRRQKYLGDDSRPDVTAKTAIIVDDGIATGLTMMAAVEELKSRSPAKVVVAIPVAPEDVAATLMTMADELVSLEIDPYYLGAVGAYYRMFDQVDDAEVIAILKKSRTSHRSSE